MEPPINAHADAIRDEKLKVLRSLKPWTQESLSQDVVRGQYASGSIDGAKVPGYREELGVNPNGALGNLAGLCNPEGNVLAMMPHPERASFLRQVPGELGGDMGAAVLGIERRVERQDRLLDPRQRDKDLRDDKQRQRQREQLRPGKERIIDDENGQRPGAAERRDGDTSR